MTCNAWYQMGQSHKRQLYVASSIQTQSSDLLGTFAFERTFFSKRRILFKLYAIVYLTCMYMHTVLGFLFCIAKLNYTYLSLVVHDRSSTLKPPEGQAAWFPATVIQYVQFF